MSFIFCKSYCLSHKGMFFTFNAWLCHFYWDTKVTKHRYECYLKYFCKHTYKGLAVKYSYKLSFISRDFWIKYFNWCNLAIFTKLKNIIFASLSIQNSKINLKKLFVPFHCCCTLFIMLIFSKKVLQILKYDIPTPN